MSEGNGSAELAKVLKSVEKDNVSGSIELAHKAIMGLFQTRKNSPNAEKLDRMWLSWAKRARPECRVFYNLAEAATKKPGPVAWARESLPFWLLTVLYNSVAKSVKTGASLVKPGDKILIHSYSSTVVHSLTMARDQLPEIYLTKHPHSMKAGRAMQKEGLPVRVVTLEENPKVNKVLIGCDSYDLKGRIVNAKGTQKILEWAAERKIPAYCIATWLKRSKGVLQSPRNKSFELVTLPKNTRIVGDL
jgi:hypothetical protein